MTGLAPDFHPLPRSDRLVLSQLRLPKALVPDGAPDLPPVGFPHDEDLVAADLLIADGTLAAIGPPGSFDGEMAVVEMEQAMALPRFTDMHTHLDKGHIWPRNPNPDGTFEGALNAIRADSVAHWSADDVRTRMQFGLECAYAHGTGQLRTHIDSIAPQHEISWPVFAELKADWADRITLQGSSLNGIDGLIDDAMRQEIHRTAIAHGGMPGAVTYMIPELRDTLTKMIKEADQGGHDLDFHVDETLDPGAQSLAMIAELALEVGYEGRITCGHCCSLSTQDGDTVARTLDLVGRAGITIVSLPLCNLYLQDRRAADAPPRTPRQRGVTLLHEMKTHGIPVAIASDNTRDPFYAYGDLDALEVYRETTRIAHLDHPIGDWITSITTAPATTMKVDGGLTLDGPADMILFRARSFSELLSRPHLDRIVLHQGHAIERSLPDYRRLDILFESKFND